MMRTIQNHKTPGFINGLLENEPVKENESHKWEIQSRRNLSEVLKLVNQDFKIDWYIQELPETWYGQKLNIHFLNKNSGTLLQQIELINRKELSETRHATHNGYLAYCQSANGRIQVIFGYPPASLKLSKLYEQIGEFSPDQITENLIDLHVQDLLKKPSSERNTKKHKYEVS